MRHCISHPGRLIALILTLSLTGFPAWASDSKTPAPKVWPGVSWSYIKLTAATGSRQTRPRGRQRQWRRDHVTPKAAVPNYPKWLIRGKKASARLSSLQAQKVLSLAKLTHGDVVLSKCPAIFRHFFEFFNQKNQMVAQIVVCFECDIVRISPHYFPIPPQPEENEVPKDANAEGEDSAENDEEEEDFGPIYNNGVKALKGYASLVRALKLPFLSPRELRNQRLRELRKLRPRRPRVKRPDNMK